MIISNKFNPFQSILKPFKYWCNSDMVTICTEDIKMGISFNLNAVLNLSHYNATLTWLPTTWWKKKAGCKKKLECTCSLKTAHNNPSVEVLSYLCDFNEQEEMWHLDVFTKITEKSLHVFSLWSHACHCE